MGSARARATAPPCATCPLVINTAARTRWKDVVGSKPVVERVDGGRLVRGDEAERVVDHGNDVPHVGSFPLPGHLQAAALRERWIAKRAPSRSSRTHICTLYDVGDHQGAAFLVMEHLEGAPAGCAQGALPLDPALETALGFALAA